MTKHPVKPELLAPAGNFEKLKIATHYGADAVYFAGKDFSLRNFSGNFSNQELFEAVQYAHDHNVKAYITCNIYSRTQEQGQIESFLKMIGKVNPDAIIISDPGIIFMAMEIIPDIDIHLSTQANTTNLNAAKFWQKTGIKRVNLARELSMNEIEQLSQAVSIETETFIHGAMCVSYSGRCLLSNLLSGRDSNQGLCSHPCRWKYSVVEELRPNEFHPLMEDKRGAYIFNSKDLCMINHIPDLIQAGISSLKIEGRMKGINYLATVVKAYRQAIDRFSESPANYQIDPEWIEMLDQIYHRDYCTGFYYDSPLEPMPNYNNVHQGKIHNFVGKILKKHPSGEYEIQIRNKLCDTDTIEILSSSEKLRQTNHFRLSDMEGLPIKNAHPNTSALVKLDIECKSNDIVRKI